MNRKHLIFILTFFFCHYCISVQAFDDTDTHPRLTKAVTDNNPNLKNALVTFIGYSSGFNKVFQGIDSKGYDRKINVLKWLQQGSTDEDALNRCRASNHFHNPIHTGDWTQSQMIDSVFIDNVCGTTNRYSAVTWATGYTSPGGVYIKDRIGQYLYYGGFLVDTRQDRGWDDARVYLYNALTSVTPAIREENFVKVFKAVGQVMHLLQDMAVPAHVRNDMQSHLANGLNTSKWGSNPFEKYVITHYNALNAPPVKPTFSAPMRHTDFWDKNNYTGENPSKGTDQGLAEYTNANFLSDFTMFRPVSDTLHYFKYPNQATSVSKAHYTIADPINPGQTIKRTYFQKIKDGDDGYRLAGVGFLYRWVPLINSKRIHPLDDYVHDDYAKKILPRAVGYSAALLDYFFRGSLSITTAPGDITFRSIKITASNSTTGEPMGIGDVSLVIRYKTLSETSLGEGKYLLNNPSADYSYKVATLNNVNLATPQPLTFDFGNAPLPLNFSDMTMQLVFKGKLGNEDGAVAVSTLKPITSIYSDFTLSLPPSGVYSKTSDSSPTATFNELRVTALSNIPGGLSGGSINLALEYRTAIGNQFLSVLVDTEPANAAGYVFRTPEKNDVNSLPQGVPVELVFDLASLQLPVQATDVQLNIVYTKADGVSQAIGVRDISEPTPVDVYNNTDYSCLNGAWYRYDDPTAMAIVDSNGDGIADRSDIYPHSISNISFLAGSADAIALDASTSNTLSASGPLQTGQKLRIGYILTDNANRYAINEIRTGQNGDPWPHAATNNRIFPGTGFRNDAAGWGMMFAFRDIKMWWGTSVIFINKEYPVGSTCTWEALNQKLGL